MLRVQIAQGGKYPRTYITAKIGDGRHVGYDEGTHLTIHTDGTRMFFTNEKTSLPGFTVYGDTTSFSSQNRSQIHIPKDWVVKHLVNTRLVQMIYTKIGVFMLPYNSEVYSEY